MKIPNSVRNLYLDLEEIYKPLEAKVDETLNSLKKTRWHYESRIKQLESFALKLETGRCLSPTELEDFFACTIVVENLNSVSDAEELIKQRFDFIDRRPKDTKYTTKPPDSFRFDDLRLYVKWKDAGGARPSGLKSILFEVQIKTFLQHAWSIATHDLIFKSDEKSWPKERIAYQVKAMLEHAEISIQEAATLAKSNTLDKADKLTKRISMIIGLLNKLWEAQALPKDVKRLAENIDQLIYNLDVKLNELRDIINKETENGKGIKTHNLSPYGIIIQSLFNQIPDRMNGFLLDGQKKFKIFIPKEVELPNTLNPADIRNGILI